MKKLLLTITAFFFILTPAFAQSAGWMNTAWLYRSPVTVSNPNSSALTQFQVNLTLGAETDFTKLQPNGADLRVTAGDGVTQLPLWIESFNAAASTASIWVNVPNIPVAGTTLYIYYGNAAAASVSNGNSVFEFFDDFESPYGKQPGYFALSSPTTALVQSQAWEASPPHTLSVLTMNAGGYTYWGYYGLYSGCGGVGLAYSNDLTTWTKDANNPLFTNGRWPRVEDVNGTIYMVFTEDYCLDSYIELATSTDGIHFTNQQTIVAAQSGLRNQNPYLFFNPNDNLWYLYYYHGDDSSSFDVRVRSATSITGLSSAADTVVMHNTAKTAAPSMFYYNGVYYLAVEATDPTAAWVTNVYSSTSPTSGFTLLPGNPVLNNGGACMFQQQFGTTLHAFNCQQTNGNWTLQHRTADLTAGPQQFGTFDPAKWQISGGGTWAIVPDTQLDGSQGMVAQGQTTDRQILVTPNFNATNYVLQANSKLVLGSVWGLGVNATAFSNQYSINLYQDYDSTYNVFSYGWFNNTGPQANTQVLQLAAGALPPEVWSKLVAKVHNNTIQVTENGQSAQGTNATLASGGVALYGEAGTNAEWDNVLVRQYAAVDPTATIGAPTSSGIGSMAVSPTSVLGGNSSQGTVTLEIAAPAGGVQVALSSDNPAASVPSSVVVAQGQTTANFNVTTTPVGAITTADISATVGGGGVSAALTIYPYVSSLSVSPATVQGGTSTQGSVSLFAAAPAGGTTISLSSGNPLASVPPTLVIPAGQSSGSFTITTSPVSANTLVQITAGVGGANQSTTITLTPSLSLSSLALSPAAVLAGSASQGVVTLSGPAPAGGAAVSLTSGSVVAGVPATVTVPVNATSATFAIATTGTSATVQVSIGASYLGGTQSAILTVQQVLASLSLAQSQINGGASVQGTVTISAAAPAGGEAVSLLSDNAAVSVPATVTVPAGANSANFTVTTSSVASTTTANITASSYGSSQTAALTLLSSQSGWLNSAWQYRSAVTITNPGGVALTNFQVEVPLGASFNFAQAAAGGADIRFTASDGVTLLPLWIESWNATTSAATLWVNVPSIPAGGISLYMYYGNPSAATASNGNATFDFFDDFSEASLDTTKWTVAGGTWSVVNGTDENGATGGVLQGTTTSRQILYSSFSGTDYVAEVFGKQTSGHVWGLGVRATNNSNLDSINLYDSLNSSDNLYVYSWVNDSGSNATATLGEYAAGTVSANTWYHLTARVHGTAIDILKDNVPAVSVTSSSLPSGGIALYGEAGTVAQWNDVLIRKYAAVDPAATLGAPISSGIGSVAVSPTSVMGGSSSQGTVTLEIAAPAGGAQVALSSDNPAASVPSSVVVAQGQTTANFNVTTTPVGAITTADISATVGGGGVSAALTIYPYVSSLSVSPATVQGGTSTQGSVSLFAAAPAGGTTISLSSGNPLASVPPTLVIPAGQSSGSFTITTSPVSANTLVQITAGVGGANQSTTITLTPSLSLSSLALSPAAVLAGSASQGVVTLSGPAPAGGAAVSLTSGSVVAGVPATVTVPVNATSATFAIATTGTSATVQVSIGASYLGGTQSAILTVQQVLASLSLAQSQINGGASVQGTVTISAAAPAGGEAVSLLSDNAAVSVPATVTVPAGANSANFTVTTSSVASTTTANITASSYGSSQTAALTLLSSQSGWLNSAWQYRSAVTITNPGGVALTNFQVEVPLGASFNFAQAAAGGADIRFTASDGVTLLPLWIESWNATTSAATLWVNVPSIPAGGISLYMYYGNPSAATASNGNATFDFFDDFSEASLDTTKWTVAGGTWSVVNGTDENGATGGVLQGSTTNRQILYSTFSGTDYVAEVFGKQTSGRVWGLGVRATNNSNLDSINLYDNLNSNDNLYVYSWVNDSGGNATATLGEYAAGTVNANTWYHLTARVHGTAIDILKDNAPAVSVTSSSLPSGGIALYGEAGTVAEWNDVLIRKYAATEPAATVGVSMPPGA